MTTNIKQLLRAAAAVALVATGLSATPVEAGHGDHFTCRASLVRATGAGPLALIGTVEPVVANRADEECTADNPALVPALDTSPLPAGLGSVRALYAETTVADNAATAAAGVLDITLKVPVVGEVQVQVLTSDASAQCTSATNDPALEGSSRVVALRINNSQPVNVNESDEIKIVDALSVATVYLNRKIETENQITQRALEIDVPGVVNIVVAESIADFHGKPCANGGNGDGDRFPGWMSGGGYVAQPDTQQDHNDEGSVDPGTRAQHAFSIDCFYPTGDDAGRKDHLVAQWFDDAAGERAMFKTEAITDAACTDDPDVNPGKPNSSFDTIEGSGTGTCKLGGVLDVPATVEFTFTDGGEPQNDHTSITVTSPLGPVGCNYTVEGFLDGGNHQAHQTRAQQAAPAA